MLAAVVTTRIQIITISRHLVQCQRCQADVVWIPDAYTQWALNTERFLAQFWRRVSRATADHFRSYFPLLIVCSTIYIRSQYHPFLSIAVHVRQRSSKQWNISAVKAALKPDTRSFDVSVYTVRRRACNWVGFPSGKCVAECLVHMTLVLCYSHTTNLCYCYLSWRFRFLPVVTWLSSR